MTGDRPALGAIRRAREEATGRTWLQELEERAAWAALRTPLTPQEQLPPALRRVLDELLARLAA